MHCRRDLQGDRVPLRTGVCRCRHLSWLDHRDSPLRRLGGNADAHAPRGKREGVPPSSPALTKASSAWEVSRKEPRQHAAGRRLGEGASLCGLPPYASLPTAIASPRLSTQPPNPAASKSVIGPSSKVPQFLAWRPDGKLHVFIVDTDVAVSHDFSSHGRTPSAFHWEQSDPKFIGVETRPGPHSVAPPQLPVTVPVTGTAAMAAPTITAVVGDHDDSGQRQLEVTTLFCTPEGDLRLKDSFAPPGELSSLIATQVPHYCFLGASQETTPADVSDECGVPSSSTTASPGRTLAGKDSESTRRNVRRLRGVVMRDFIGMEVADEATRRALVDFSYYLTVGNLDEAHKAVKLVKSAAVWQVRSTSHVLLLCTAIPPSSAHVGVVLTCCVLHASSEHGDYVC